MNTTVTTNKNGTVSPVFSWIFGIVVAAIGVLNMVLVHPVPGIIFLVLSLVYFPPLSEALRKNAGSTVSLIIKVALGVAIIWFTLGISDLGEILGF